MHTTTTTTTTTTTVFKLFLDKVVRNTEKMHIGRTRHVVCIWTTRNACVYKSFGGETKREGLL
jgi:hypothetical protein